MTLTDPQTQRIMDALAIADIRLGMGGSGATKDEVDAIRGAIGIFPEHDFIPSDLEGERMTARELADRIRWEMSPHWVELPDDVGSPHKVPSDINSAVALIEAHDAEVRDLGKTVPMEMLYGIHQLPPDNFEKAVVRYVNLCGYTVTEGKEDGR